MSATKVLICTEDKGALYEIDFCIRIGNASIARWKNDAAKMESTFGRGYLAGYEHAHQNFVEVRSKIKPLPSDKALALLADQLSSADREEFAKKLLGLCIEKGCSDHVLSEDEWSVELDTDAAQQWCKEHFVKYDTPVEAY